MRLRRRELLGVGAASLVSGIPEGGAPEEEMALREPAGPDQAPCLTIRSYLSHVAARITGGALREMRDAESWRRLVPARRRQYMDMMGLADLPAAADRPAVPYTVTGKIERPQYRIEKLYYESLPGLFVTANLYIPRSQVEAQESRPGGRVAGAPGVLYVCGHAPQQKAHYQAHPRRFAELGFVCLIVETIQLGEAAGFHHGCYREGWFHWYSRGYSPAAVELLNGIRGLDLLARRPEVNDQKLGVTGISGGGASSWWIAAGDERIKASAPVCGTATLEAHIYDRVIDGHCDCMFWLNSRRWDLADVGSLIAPRPLLIASANQDGIFPINSIRKVHGQLKRLYGTLGKPDHVRLIETPGGHSYHERSRTGIFSWFLRHLMDREVAPDSVGDIELDESKLEPEASLRVYGSAPPAANRALTIHDEFIKLPSPPTVASAGDLPRERDRIISLLREHTFGAFPEPAPRLDLKEEYALDGGAGFRFAFTSEAGWRLHGKKMHARDLPLPAPAVVVLRDPGEDRNGAEAFSAQIRAPWVRIVVEPRGTGETVWGEDQQWHLRRAAAWTGRTLASMRVWDTLRSLEAARALPGVNRSSISLAARGEMAAVALYAALLDGRVQTLFLESPPETQNAPSRPDGRGPAIEMLNCLRFTDLAQVAGLLHPTTIVAAGDIPSQYLWAEQLYARLGSASRFLRVKSLSEWRPS